MPKIAKIREIEGHIWVKVGKPGEFESGIALLTPEEQQRHHKESYTIGFKDAEAGEPYNP